MSKFDGVLGRSTQPLETVSKVCRPGHQGRAPILTTRRQPSI